MKNSESVETPLLNIERNPMILAAYLSCSAAFVYINYVLFVAVNPWAFLLMIPTSVITFQTLWLLLHPFAMVFSNRIEIKHSLFSNKRWYFIDIKKITETESGKLYITYKDGDIERLNLFGIKKNHLNILKNEIEKKITAETATTP